MPTSQARIDANRKNAALSTGPKTPEGKERSRRNGLKHGLTGAGIVLLEEDAEAFEAREAAFLEDLSPRSAVGAFMVKKLALMSIRIERSAENESAAIALRVRNAALDFDRSRLDEADRLFDVLGNEPRVNLRKLRQSPEGVERLIAGWHQLRSDLTRQPRPLWTAWHRERAENLTGYRIDDAPGSEIATLSKASWGDFGIMGGEKLTDAQEDARKKQARAALLVRIDAEIAKLEAHYETLDLDAIAIDRLEAPSRALFDPSPEATLARRYEADAHRGFDKALKDLRRVEAEAAERPAVAGSPELPEIYAPMASCRERVQPAPRETEPTEETGRTPLGDAVFETILRVIKEKGTDPDPV